MKRPLSRRRVFVPAQAQRPRWPQRLLWWMSLAVFGFYGVCLSSLFYLKWLPPLSTAVQLQRHLEALILLEPYAKKYDFVPLAEMSSYLPHAAVAAEDARFFDHGGIDWRELEIVVDKAQQHGHLTRGGSTITQQLMKNLFLTTY